MLVISVTIDQQGHQAEFLRKVLYVDDTPQVACSMCNRFRFKDNWYCPEDFFRQLAGQGSFQVLHVTHVICPQCTQQFVRQLAPKFAFAHCSSEDLQDYPGSPVHSPGPSPPRVLPAHPPRSSGAAQLRVLIVDDDRISARIFEALCRSLRLAASFLTNPLLVREFLQVVSTRHEACGTKVKNPPPPPRAHRMTSIQGEI